MGLNQRNNSNCWRNQKKHIVEAAGAIGIRLTQEEMRRLEQLAEATGIDSRGEWEHSME